MIFYSNTTTDRLEAYARARGLDLGIAKTPDNGTGLWHIVAQNGQPLVHWFGLGWTVDEVRERICQLAVEG